jgi:hypothetical protein
MGGAIVPAFRVDAVRAGIRDGRINSWDAIHHALGSSAHSHYPLDKACHAWDVLCYVTGGGAHDTAAVSPSSPAGRALLKESLEGLIPQMREIAAGVYTSRAKDWSDPFRAITYRNAAEMEAVAGTPENNSFVKQSREDLLSMEERVRALLREIAD